LIFKFLEFFQKIYNRIITKSNLNKSLVIEKFSSIKIFCLWVNINILSEILVFIWIWKDLCHIESTNHTFMMIFDLIIKSKFFKKKILTLQIEN